MKDTIKIGTVNFQNNEINRMQDVRKDGFDSAEIVAQHIEKEQFDILGTQELTRNFVRAISKNLKGYQFYGGYRYGNNIISKNLSFINDFNENNSIVTKNEVIQVKTKKMPFLTGNLKDLKKALKKHSLMIRIVTIVLIKTAIGNVCAMNTHLTYQNESLQKRQLQFLKRLIKKYLKHYPVVLMGDFNMEITNPNFKQFIEDMAFLGLKRVEINEKTNALKYSNKTAIDHLFLPQNWEVVNFGTRTLENVTDHKEVFVEVKKI